MQGQDVGTMTGSYRVNAAWSVCVCVHEHWLTECVEEAQGRVVRQLDGSGDYCLTPQEQLANNFSLAHTGTEKGSTQAEGKKGET